MPDAPTVAWMDDRLVDFSQARVPLDDRGLQFAESLYEVIPVTAHRPRYLAEHIERMHRGATELQLQAGVPRLEDWQRLFTALHERESLGEGLLYAQVTGGSTPRIHVPATRPEPLFFAYLSRFRFPRRAAVERGIGLGTVADPRWARCDLKTTMLLPAVIAKREASRVGASEALFLGPGGQVREGGSSNLFLVEGRSIVTPAQTHHLLPGITRTIVSELAREAGLQVKDADITVERLQAADEVFVSSTTLLVMPVVQMDGQPLGRGTPGPVAGDLAARLRRQLDLGDT